MPVLRNRSLASAAKRFRSSSEITRSKARSISAVGHSYVVLYKCNVFMYTFLQIMNIGNGGADQIVMRPSATPHYAYLRERDRDK